MKSAWVTVRKVEHVIHPHSMYIDFGKRMTVSESDNDAAWALRKASDDVGI
jgi:hypothetical protein